MNSDLKRLLRKLEGSKKPDERTDLEGLKKRIEFHQEKRIEEEEIAESSETEKRHRRHANTVRAQGERIGSTMDRLSPLIKKAKKPKIGRQFEAALPKLVELYGPIEAFKHMSNGQLMKYDLVELPEGLAILNVKNSKYEWRG